MRQQNRLPPTVFEERELGPGAQNWRICAAAASPSMKSAGGVDGNKEVLLHPLSQTLLSARVAFQLSRPNERHFHPAKSFTSNLHPFSSLIYVPLLNLL